jgi:hypothetical protein
VNDDRRREVGVRGRDLGGAGIVPPPIVRPRRDQPSDRQPPADQGDGGRRLPDPPARAEQPDRRAPPEFRPERVRPPAPVEAERPRIEPRREPESRPRVEPPARPRVEAPAKPRVEPPAPRPSEPRAEPKRETPRDKPDKEPELKRRKP